MLVETQFAHHLGQPLARGHTPADAFTGAAGGAACGDLVRISLALAPDDCEGRIADAGFDASGCGAAIAAGSAAVALVRGAPLLEAARVGANEIAAELGGLHPAKLHAAELAADALHRALGAAARERAELRAPRDLGSPSGVATPGEGDGLGEDGQPAERTPRALVAMSGGVDSAVAALLTARGGEQVVGVTLELWSDAENDGERSCCSAHAVRGARALAHAQGLPHFSIDLRAEFRAGVVEPWLVGHAGGQTPNPCVRCNGNVRLDAMLELADRLGAERLVTGHYARVQRDCEDDNHNDSGRAATVRGHKEVPAEGGTPLLRMARDPIKDQSYVLAGLDPTSLARLRFPLGEMTKEEVREIARREGLAVARKPDSQDLCFLAGTRLPRFLERHSALDVHEGDILDSAGARLGRHRGAHSYTVGQRHGLGLGGRAPLYVLGTDPEANTVTVGSREELLTSTLAVRDVTLRRPGARVEWVKIRSRGRRHRCALAADLSPGRHERVELRLREPIERTAPGQIACLYDGDAIVGYGALAP